MWRFYLYFFTLFVISEEYSKNYSAELSSAASRVVSGGADDDVKEVQQYQVLLSVIYCLLSWTKKIENQSCFLLFACNFTFLFVLNGTKFMDRHCRK